MATASKTKLHDSVDSRFDVDRALGVLILRMTLGLNILLHGVTRTITGSLAGFVGNTVKTFQNSPLPEWQVRAFATIIPFCELAIGIMLLLGLATRWTLIAGSLLMAGLIFGTALRSDWNLLELQMFYCLLYFILFMCQRYDVYSVKTLTGRKH